MELLEIIIIIVLNGLIDVIFVAWMAGWRSKRAIQAWLESDEADDALHRIMENAWVWFLKPSIKTKKMVEHKDETGAILKGEEEVLLSPFQNLASELGRYATMQFRSKFGSDKRTEQAVMQSIQSDLMDPSTDLGGQLSRLLPMTIAKASKSGDWAGVIAQMLIPQLLKKLNIGGQTSDKHGGSGGLL